MALDSLTGLFREAVPPAQGQDQHLMSVAQVNCSFYFKYITKRFKQRHFGSKTIYGKCYQALLFEYMYLFIHILLEKFDIRTSLKKCAMLENKIIRQFL